MLIYPEIGLLRANVAALNFKNFFLFRHPQFKFSPSVGRRNAFAEQLYRFIYLVIVSLNYEKAEFDPLKPGKTDKK